MTVVVAHERQPFAVSIIFQPHPVLWGHGVAVELFFFLEHILDQWLVPGVQKPVFAGQLFIFTLQDGIDPRADDDGRLLF